VESTSYDGTPRPLTIWNLCRIGTVSNDVVVTFTKEGDMMSVVCFGEYEALSQFRCSFAPPVPVPLSEAREIWSALRAEGFGLE